MHDDTLVCTFCDEIVRTTHGYDGYVARCSCSRFALQAGSGEKPRTWERLEDLLNPSDFTVENDWSDGNGDVDSIICTVCGTDEATTVEIDEAPLAPLDVKIMFKCSNEHHRNDRELTETAYYNEHEYDAEKLIEYCADGSDSND
jgi:hypothetical protein